jgi:hypothetical protein
MDGLFGILRDRKWVFAYVVLALVTWKDPTSLATVISVLAPVILGVNAFEKSQWRKHGLPKQED